MKTTDKEQIKKLKEENKFKQILYKDFIKWYKIVYWNDEEIKPKEKHLKQYLGYFGINKRNEVLK
jgi:hypothetical protein